MKDGNKNNHFCLSHGFTMVEIIIALSFLAITLLATGSMIINIARSGSVNRKSTLACTLCQTKLEALKSLGYEAVSNSEELNLNESGNSGGIYNRRVTVTDGSTADTKIVTVEVSWTDTIKPHTVSVRTLMTPE